MTDNKLKRNVADTLKKMNQKYSEIPDSGKADDKLVKLFMDVSFKYFNEHITKYEIEIILGSLKSSIIAFLMTQLSKEEKESTYQTGLEAKSILDIGTPKEKWA